MTGTLPQSVTQLQGLTSLDASFNRLTGALPAAMAINASTPVAVVNVAGNAFAGPVPSWPAATNAILAIQPGNEALCGEVAHGCWARGWGGGRVLGGGEVGGRAVVGAARTRSSSSRVWGVLGVWAWCCWRQVCACVWRPDQRLARGT